MKTAAWAAMLAAALIAFPALPAAAQEAACLVKRDRTGGSLGFIVLARDAAMFERAGFARVACPEDIADRAPRLVRRCARFERQSKVGRAAIAELYGLSVAEMCRATRAWAAAVGAGEVR